MVDPHLALPGQIKRYCHVMDAATPRYTSAGIAGLSVMGLIGGGLGTEAEQNGSIFTSLVGGKLAIAGRQGLPLWRPSGALMHLVGKVVD